VGDLINPAKASVQDLLEEFQSLEGDTLMQLQLQLLVNGFDTRKLKNVRLGSPDPGSYSAYTKALKASARSGQSLDEILNAVSVTPDILSSMAGSGSTRVNVVQHRAQADVEKAALEGFQKAIGRAPSERERTSFISAYRQAETGAQPDTSGGGTFTTTDSGSPEIAAEAYARKTNPKLAQGMTRMNAANVMLQTLGVE
jgi:hypothetical protein